VNIGKALMPRTPFSPRCLSGQITARTSSSRISAAVPGKVLKPTALSCARNDRIGIPSVAA
jgi:hypothetical protein